MKTRFFVLFLLLTVVFFSACSSVVMRGDGTDLSSVDGDNISARGAIGGIRTADDPRFEGNGGRDIRLAILAPQIQGNVPAYLPLYVQGLLNTNFGKYSTITLIDRQNLDKIISEQNIASSGSYSDTDYVKIGNLTNTRYFLIGTIQRLSGDRYSLQLSVTDASTGVRRANYMKDGTLTQIEGNGALINDASADILGQLGVKLTATGRQALLAGSTTTVQAAAGLARGISAQSAGQEVAALLNFSQSVAFDPSQIEALSRLTNLSSTVSGGSISERILSDIDARNQWIATFKETARFFKDHPPFEIVFDPNLVQIGETDYVKETANLGMRIALNSTDAGFRVLNTLLEGLEKTGRRGTWRFDGWPLKNNNPTQATEGTVVFEDSRSDNSFEYKVEVALINERNKTLGKSVVTLNSGGIAFASGNTRVTSPQGAFNTVHFSNIKASDLTPTLTIVIEKVNGTPTRNLPSGYMRIDTGNLETRAAQHVQAEQIAAAQAAQEKQQKKAKSGSGLMTAAYTILAVGGIGVLVYFIWIKPKKNDDGGPSYNYGYGYR